MLNRSTAETSIGPLAQPRTAELRVAIVSDAAPERNGVGAYYRDLADHLRAAGVRVDLVAPRCRAGSWYGGLTLPLPGDPTQKIVLPSPWFVSRRLARLRPNVVIVPTPGPFGMLGMHLAERSGAALVVGFHTHFEALTTLFQNWGIGARIANGYLGACHRLLFGKSDLVLANSAEMMAIARSIGARRVSLMATPIPRRFLDLPPVPARRQLARVLFAGRLAPEKNLDAIVAAARRLPDIEFLIVGDGPLRAWVEEQCRGLPNLRHSGWVRRSRIMALIDEMDALILPSTVESFGTIALEAMARARPVLVSSACGILSWDLLSRGIFRIHEGEHLADALVRLRDLDPAIRERKARLGREGARDINHRNLQHWLAVLSGDYADSVDVKR
ncbi:glycosyltransferase [Thiocapsa sp.]|uniref:glycosyltransferase n=1 Tax=Thiocapsa sp. TaxID=2024551 RepID=UPI0025EE0207|nr:glycosyltransferase [Thiocapsa sp.]